MAFPPSLLGPPIYPGLQGHTKRKPGLFRRLTILLFESNSTWSKRWLQYSWHSCSLYCTICRHCEYADAISQVHRAKKYTFQARAAVFFLVSFEHHFSNEPFEESSVGSMQALGSKTRWILSVRTNKDTGGEKSVCRVLFLTGKSSMEFYSIIFDYLHSFTLLRQTSAWFDHDRW